MNNDYMYHIGLKKEDIKGAKYAILPGDPKRVIEIAKYLEKPKALNVNREYTSMLGQLNNEYILVISTGMGGPSTAICVEELYRLGIKNIIRVGTCGGMQDNVLPGDLIIAQAAIRQEGTTKEYVPVEYPAVSDFDLTCSIKEACLELGYKNHVGVVQCKDSFYGQHNPDDAPISYELNNKWNAWIKTGALASEMETASLFIISSIKRIRSAAILLTIWNQELEKKGISQNNNFDIDKEIKACIKAIEIDMKKNKMSE